MSNKPSTYAQRQEWRSQHLLSADPLITKIPKIELHVHIEGTLSPSLRWKLSQRNNIPLSVGISNTPLASLAEVEAAYTQIRGRIGAASAESQNCFTFFEIYYGGFELLRTEEDYYDLAMGYFGRAKEMGVVYCEPFFDIQGHLRRGVPVEVVMRGFKRAQIYAEEKLNVRCMILEPSPCSHINRSNPNGSCACFETCRPSPHWSPTRPLFPTEI